MVRVFLLDDHELVRTGLRALIDGEDDMEVIGEAGTAEEGLAQIVALKPDVAILDVRLPDGNGIEVCREIQSNHPDTKCLILTSYSDDEAHFAAIMAGAAGYLLKEIGGRDLIGDVRRVSRGASLLDPRLSQELFDRLREDREGEARLAELTPQERKVLELIAKGRSNRQIADEIFLAEGTIKNYVSRLLSKLGMQRRTEAAVFATRLAERKQPSPEGSKSSQLGRWARCVPPSIGPIETRRMGHVVQFDPTAGERPFQASTLGVPIGKASRIVLDSHDRAQPEQRAIVIQLERQPVGDRVAGVGRAPVETAAALDQYFGQFDLRSSQFVGVDAVVKNGEEFAVHRHSTKRGPNGPHRLVPNSTRSRESAQRYVRGDPRR